MSFGLGKSFGRIIKPKETFEDVCKKMNVDRIESEVETDTHFITHFKDGSHMIVNKKCLGVIRTTSH